MIGNFVTFVFHSMIQMYEVCAVNSLYCLLIWLHFVIIGHWICKGCHGIHRGKIYCFVFFGYLLLMITFLLTTSSVGFESLNVSKQWQTCAKVSVWERRQQELEIEVCPGKLFLTCSFSLWTSFITIRKKLKLPCCCLSLCSYGIVAFFW